MPHSLSTVDRRRATSARGAGLLLGAVTLLAIAPTLARAGEADGVPSTVSYRNDVMAVLAKAGCNMGACHGNKSGKGGLKLSLRGQDPSLDYDTLTRDLFGRRVNTLEPDQSLILAKATTQVPHEGGLRFRADAVEYGILRQWIEAGARRDGESVPALEKLDVTPAEQVLLEPADQVRVKAVAHFSDGSTRDVSRLAVYEQSADLASISPDGLVQRKRFGETTVIVRFLQLQQAVRLAFVPARPDFAWRDTPANNYVDEHVFAKLRTLRMNPSGLCDDTVFVRRAYLDLLGMLPTPDEAKAFVADSSSDKRAKLVDRLLERPEYADFWAMKWSDVLRNEERTLDRTGVKAFHGWIRQSVADNKPLDQFVRELLGARGSTYANPPANYYRANRDPVTRGEATAELFLGVRLQCAQCHNHPFDRWTQDDYYGWADVFSRVDYKIVENLRKDKNDSHEFIGEQFVLETETGGVTDPRGVAVKTHFLGDVATPVAGERSRLDALAKWVTSPANPFFARSQVNRIWFHLMGRGIVDPVDDFRATNPPSHPALLDALAKDFAEHGYDVRRMIRLVMASRAYGLAAEPNDTNADDEVNYSHAIPRRLTAEQLLDAEHEFAGVAAEFAGYDKGIRAAQIPGVRAVTRREGGKPSIADQFLVSFGKPQRQLVCECERTNETTLGQTFQLIAGPEVARLLADPENRIGKLVGAAKTDEQAVEELYWAALTRPPDADERKAMADHVRDAKDRRKGLEDVAWALLNAKEFVLRR